MVWRLLPDVVQEIGAVVGSAREMPRGEDCVASEGVVPSTLLFLLVLPALLEGQVVLQGHGVDELLVLELLRTFLDRPDGAQYVPWFERLE